MIGSRPAGVVGDEWEAVSRAVRALVSDIVCRHLLEHATEASDPELVDLVRQRPDWLGHHLDALAVAGRLTGPNIEELAATLHDVQRWRLEHRLDDTTPPAQPLGPAPFDPLVRSRHRSLSAKLAVAPDRTGGRGIA